MTQEPNDRMQRAIDAVAAYIARHPQAADSVDGIAQVWLPAMGVDVPRAHLQAALDRLVETRVLHSVALVDGGVIYRASASGRQH